MLYYRTLNWQIHASIFGPHIPEYFAVTYSNDAWANFSNGTWRIRTEQEFMDL